MLPFSNHIPTKKFRKLLTKHFSPEIRKLGFKGSGNNFRRDNGDHFIHLIQLFPRSTKDALSLLLARLHLYLGDQAKATEFADFGLSRVKSSYFARFLKRVKQGSLEFG